MKKQIIVLAVLLLGHALYAQTDAQNIQPEQDKTVQVSSDTENKYPRIKKEVRTHLKTPAKISHTKSAANSGATLKTGPRLIAVTATPPPAPPGFVNYPPEAPHAWHIEMANVSYAGMDIKAYGLSDKLSDADKARVRILRYKDGAITDVTTGIDPTGTTVLGTTTDYCTPTCIFALVAPIDIFDKVGPKVNLYADNSFELAGKLYTSSNTRVGITAADISGDVFTISGVATTYYLIDAEPSTRCLHAPYNPLAQSGTCANPIYAGLFTLPEGRHSVYYVSQDKAGNYSEAKTAAIIVDATAPTSQLRLNGKTLAPGGAVSATDAEFLTLTAKDPVSNGVLSGLATSYFLIDISPEECDYSDWTGGINGRCSCEDPSYPGPIKLPKGEHTVYYSSKDNVGNQERVKTVNIVVK